MAEGDEVEEILKESSAASVFIVFYGNYLPLGVFARHLVKVKNKCREKLSIHKPKFFSNYTLLPFKFSGIKLDVYLMKLSEKIKVGVAPREGVDQVFLSRFLLHLQEVLTSFLEEIKSDKSLRYREIKPAFVLKCTVCYEGRKTCLRHSRELCKEDECDHFWTLEELRHYTEEPVCVHGSYIRSVEFSLKRIKP